RLEYIAACAQPESHRALWDMTFFNLPNPIFMQQRPPMLILGAEFDRLIPPSLVYMTAASYQLPAHILPGFGHGCVMEEGWEESAQLIFDWLQAQTFDRETDDPYTPFGY
ncbi:MAG: alpha/beta hydrolase, partial [Rhodocyclaceae bacterium]|nr:alpha/beta hydrolase [Rhodocyclaceae bacterium]